MITRIEWQARVTGSEKVDNALEFAGEVERGLKASNLVPEDARVSTFYESFGGYPQVTLVWETDNEMESRDAVSA